MASNSRPVQAAAEAAQPVQESKVDVDTTITILDMGVKFSYQIPTFSVVYVDLRQVKVQLHSDDTSVTVVDAFIRADPVLDEVVPPFCVQLNELCFVPVEEFCKCVYVRHLKSLKDGLLIIWGWTDSRDEEHVQNDREESSCDDSPSTEADLSEDECGQTRETSTVHFKCVGVTRDSLYQETLKKAFLAIKDGKGVCVRLTPEPENPYDSHAVAFEYLIDGCWKVFGYVIKELSDHVLDAISKGDIIHVDFAWIKYKILKTTGAGYYTAVRVTKKEEWAQIVHTLSDTMFH